MPQGVGLALKVPQTEAWRDGAAGQIIKIDSRTPPRCPASRSR
jgi:hypothetical protein